MEKGKKKMSELQKIDVEGFVIDTDAKADWALQKIKEARADRDRWIAWYTDKIKEIKEVFDYSDAGGAPILGLKGAVLKIHGNSKATEVYYAIHRAVDYVDNNITGMIAEAIANSEELTKKGEE
jgi:fatty acid/phospholipid biosynthesis enzyme